MIVAWILYSLVVGTLMAAAAWVAERMTRKSGAPTRWIWSTAILATLAWPIAALVSGSAGDPQQLQALDAARTRMLLDPALIRIVEPFATRAGALDPLLLWVWLALSTAGIGLLVWTERRTHRLVRGLPSRTMHGVSVRVSKDLGPAVVGWPAGVIVVPRWTEELAEPECRLIIAHEHHHQRARDTLLIGVTAVAVALAPWNLPLWWMARRLRAAIEVDCDGRVLRDGTTPAAYAALLCAIAGRLKNPIRTAVAISHPTSLLERRIDHMLKPIVRTHPTKLVFAGLLVGGFIVAACEVPTPPPEEPAGEPETAQNALTAKERQAAVEGAIQEERPFILRADSLRLVPAMIDGNADGPIVYVDGKRVTSVNSLSPDQIERIEVVKGPAARRILGADHAGGVIQIFTKTGSN